MPSKYAYVDPGTGALIGGGWHGEPPANSVAVAEDFDIRARDKRWTGTAWEPYTPPAPPPVADGAGFMRSVHLSLVGVDAAAKLTRAMTLRKASAFVRDWIHNTAHTPLSTSRQAAAKTIWGWVKTDPVIGLGGSDAVNRLTTLETDAVEADAPRFGFSLT